MKVVDYRSVNLAWLVDFKDKVFTKQLAPETELIIAREDVGTGSNFEVHNGDTLCVTGETSTVYRVTRPHGDTCTGEVLKSTVEHKPREEWTTEDVVEYVIKKACMRDQCTYLKLIEYPKKNVSKEEYMGTFVSHARSCRFTDLVGALVHFYTMKGIDVSAQFVWLDIFSANQPKLTPRHIELDVLKEKKRQLTEGLHKAIRKFGGRVLFMDKWDGGAPLTRAWCLWELFGVAKAKKPLEIALPESAYDRLVVILKERRSIARMYPTIDVEKANCFSSVDLKAIHKAILAETSFEALDEIIKGQLRLWVKSKVSKDTKKGGKTRRFSEQTSAKWKKTSTVRHRAFMASHKASIAQVKKEARMPFTYMSPIRIYQQLRSFDIRDFIEELSGDLKELLPQIEKQSEAFVKNGRQILRGQWTITAQTIYVGVVCFVVFLSTAFLGLDTGTEITHADLRASPKIVGGGPAPQGRYLYAANIVRENFGHICGGSLISKDFVLTAAHCVFEMKSRPWKYKIMLGNYDHDIAEAEEESFDVLDVVVHPGYTKKRRFIENDYALIRLHGSSKHHPVKLHDGQNVLKPSSLFTAIGWGRTETFDPSRVLKKVEMKYVLPEKCKEIWALFRVVVADSVLCSLPKNGQPWNTGVYKGDSGGALVLQTGGTVESDVLVGVASWGFAVYRTNGGFPAGFARVSEGYAWIQDELAKPTPRMEPKQPTQINVYVDKVEFALATVWRSYYTKGAPLAGVALGSAFVLALSKYDRRLGINLRNVLFSMRFAKYTFNFFLPALLVKLMYHLQKFIVFGRL